MWPRFQDSPLYRRLEGSDTVLLSHAHQDHTGSIPFLRPDIPVLSTATSAFIIKANQDSGKAGFDQQACYFSPVCYDQPAGWHQPACATNRKEAKQQRQFRPMDVALPDLSPEAHRFWQAGFWEKDKADFTPCPLSAGDDSRIRCFPVDHSIPGACAWGIQTEAGWVIYSGDLRLHGKRARLTEQFIQEAAALKPRALILEGTNLCDRPEAGRGNVSEQEVYANAARAVAGGKGLVIADFSARDIDRLLTFLCIAKETDCKLAILPKDAYLLKTIRLLDSRIPDIAAEDDIVIYQKTTASQYPERWQRNIYDEYAAKTILAADVAATPDRFILCFSFFDLNELPSIDPRPGSLYVYSSSEPHDEEQEIDFRRLHQWLKHFGIRGFGLPEERDGEWQIPEDQQGLHASGHAGSQDLVRIANEIRSQVLIPVHSQHPYMYETLLKGSGISVKLPVLRQDIEL